MHDEFADWYQSTNIDNDLNQLEQRWAGVEQVSNDLNYVDIQNLVKMAFARGDDEEAENKFKGVFKEYDPGFLLSDNTYEIAVLASSVLAFRMSVDYDDAGLIATSILTTNFYDERKPEAKFDLIGIANNTIIKESQTARTRPKHKEITFPNINKQIFIKAIDAFVQNSDWAQLGQILKDMTEQSLRRTKQTRDALQDHITPVWKYIAVQDEELEMVWWLVNRWCLHVDEPFDKVPLDMRALLFGKEIADMIHVYIEPPSLIGMLSTAGVGQNDLTIPDAVNTCGTENLSKFQNPDDVCSTLTPIHFAINRAIETKCEESWIPGWQSVCGISATKKFSAIDIAMQVHRERVVLMNLADGGE